MAARSRTLALAAAAFLALAAWSAYRACADPLQRLHVRTFTLTSDTPRPRVEVPFRIALTIEVAENVADIANVYLPEFNGAEELGDERRTTHGPSGTTYVETLTLVAHQDGSLIVGSAYLDATDARDGKPKRFISNGLHLTVEGAPADLLAPVRAAIVLLIEIALFAAAVFVVVAIFRKRARPVFVSAPPAPSAAPQVPVVAPADELTQTVDELRRSRTRAAVLRVRAALWRTAGAAEGETLGDVLRRPSSNGESLRRRLILVERAAFADDAQSSAAIDEVLAEFAGARA